MEIGLQTNISVSPLFPFWPLLSYLQTILVSFPSQYNVQYILDIGCNQM